MIYLHHLHIQVGGKWTIEGKTKCISSRNREKMYGWGWRDYLRIRDLGIGNMRLEVLEAQEGGTYVLSGVSTQKEDKS